MPDAVPLHATFDTVASLYDEVRPGYPDVIIDAVIERSGLPAAGRILEIGCGTGQITRPFGRRGYAILALEFGPSLVALAAEHLRPYPQVRVVPVAFENWPIEREAFDWIDPAFGLARAAEALKPQGALALVWHLDRSEHTDFYQATQPLYERFIPARGPRVGPGISTANLCVRRQCPGCATAQRRQSRAERGHSAPVDPPPALPAATASVSLWILVPAFASGCTAMTRVEAVSNGVSAFRSPAAVNARRTLTAIVAILVALLAGVAVLSRAYGIGATEPGAAGYESVLSQLVGAVVGRGVIY